MIMFENTIHTPIRICAVHSAAENCSQVNIKKKRMHFVLFRNPILYADAAAHRGDATRPGTPCEKLAQRKLRFTQLPLMLAANALPWFHICVMWWRRRHLTVLHLSERSVRVYCLASAVYIGDFLCVVSSVCVRIPFLTIRRMSALTHPLTTHPID